MLATSLSVFTIALLGMLSPGPDFFLVVKNALNYPKKAAMMTALGVILGIAFHMSYCIAGLALVITTTPWLFNILKYAGAAYLIYIGIQALRSKGNGKMDFQQQEKTPISLKKAFYQGLLCNLLNPKATLFFLAIFTQVLAIDSTFSEKLWYAFIILIQAVVWWPLLITIIQSHSVQTALNKVHKVLDKLLGTVLVALGLKVALW
ncbi:LysE family translocator [Neisseria sp. Ec49-e6-T10]|uniref:LysE family translocator n=1 Tax=Neisseria sp. Ec49-e6-T10 TaxID=3140744 RepID=UPI003EC1113E